MLTSKVGLSFDHPEEERNLESFFLCSIEEDHLKEILGDDDIVNDGNVDETLKDVANLAKRCLRLEGEERPTMKEVAAELVGIRIKQSLHGVKLISVQKRLKIWRPTLSMLKVTMVLVVQLQNY